MAIEDIHAFWPRQDHLTETFSLSFLAAANHTASLSMAPPKRTRTGVGHDKELRVEHKIERSIVEKSVTITLNFQDAGRRGTLESAGKIRQMYPPNCFQGD